MRGGDRASSLPQEGWPVASQGPQPPCHRAHETGPTLRGTGSTRRGGRLREGKLAAPAAGRGLGVLGDDLPELRLDHEQPRPHGGRDRLHPEGHRREGTRRPGCVVVRPLGPGPNEGDPGAEGRRARQDPGGPGPRREGLGAAPRARAGGPRHARQDLRQPGRVLLRPRPSGRQGRGRGPRGSRPGPQHALRVGRCAGTLQAGPGRLRREPPALRRDRGPGEPPDGRRGRGRGLVPAEAGRGRGGQAVPAERRGGGLAAAERLGRRRGLRGAGPGLRLPRRGPGPGGAPAHRRPLRPRALPGAGRGALPQRLPPPGPCGRPAGRIAARAPRLLVRVGTGGLGRRGRPGQGPAPAAGAPGPRPGSQPAGPALQGDAGFAAWRRGCGPGPSGRCRRQRHGRRQRR
mmetsp:Transcript_74872/g.226878  ORF Transcript_74872/g.226878 Transcript_74872/m.226878 type:complete len:403 (+) Transcript_74872:506-1714(+)